MVLDTIENLDRYSFLPFIKEIRQFLDKHTIAELLDGDMPIIKDDLFVKVLRYTPKEASKGFFETHSKYADLQYVYEGSESMHYVNSKHITPTDKFKLDGDFQFFEASEGISEMVVSEGEFTIFLPGEPHKPGCLADGYTKEVLKLVFKIRIL